MFLLKEPVWKDAFVSVSMLGKGFVMFKSKVLYFRIIFLNSFSHKSSLFRHNRYSNKSLPFVEKGSELREQSQDKNCYLQKPETHKGLFKLLWVSAKTQWPYYHLFQSLG